MTSCKGCFMELLLAIGMLAVGVFFVWSVETQDLAQFGTIEHRAADGTVKENPICLFVMIGIVAVMIVVAALKLRQAEKKVIEVGAVAERHGGDPLPGVTKAADTGCGTAFGMLAVLATFLLLAWIFSIVGGL